MGNDVYANGREISCKAADGKSIASFPDVCFTPPSTLATPTGVPIPYPNTGFATDSTNGSKTVKISGKEVMLKNKSYFKKSTGDEPATRSLAMGVITHTITGKVYFNSWSMDVKFEGLNVVRHLDLTTHNHMSVPGNTPTWPYLDEAALADPNHPCNASRNGQPSPRDKERTACAPLEVKHSTGRLKIDDTQKNICADTPEAKKCQEARQCMLTPYSPDRCCDGKTGHHLVEVHGFCEPGDRDSPLPQFKAPVTDKDYDQNKAPCICASSPNTNWEAEHGDLHSIQGAKENYAIATSATRVPPRTEEYAWTYEEARRAGVDAHAATFPESDCEACVAAQLDAYHRDELGVSDSALLRTEKYGFGTKSVDQRSRGVALIKGLAEKRIGSIIGGVWK